MRVLVVNRLMDRDDPLFSGFSHDWVKALAERVERVDVVCQTTGALDLPDNVSVTAIRGPQRTSRFRMLLGFQRAIWPRARSSDVVFVHPSPSYALVAAPAACWYGRPLVQFYAGRHISMALRLAHPLVTRVVTATRETYPLSGSKVTLLGHGIDFERFSLPEPAGEGSLAERIVISVGSLTPGKNVETQIDAAAILLEQPGFEDVRFRVIGGETHWSAGYRARLEQRIAERGLEGRFQLAGSVPYAAIQDEFKAGAVFVSTSRTGGVDKVVLEAMGCALPTVVTGKIYEHLLAGRKPLLMAIDGDAGSLATRLAGVLRMLPDERRALGLELRARAVEGYEIGRFMDRLVGVFEEVIRQRSPRRAS